MERYALPFSPLAERGAADLSFDELDSLTYYCGPSVVGKRIGFEQGVERCGIETWRCPLAPKPSRARSLLRSEQGGRQAAPLPKLEVPFPASQSRSRCRARVSRVAGRPTSCT